MTRAEFDRICSALPAAANVIQWGGSSVWKVGGKVFAIEADWGRQGAGVVLKPTGMAREIWRGAEGVRPAPYLGRAGWLMIAPGAMTDGELADMIGASHALASAKLTRAQTAALGL